MLRGTRRESFAIELLAYLLFHPYLSVFFDFLFKYANILHIIHSFDYLHPLHCFNCDLIRDHIFNHGFQLVFTLQKVSVSDHLTQ